MKVGHIQDLGRVSSFKSLYIGQRLLVEVISKGQNGEGVIAIAGKQIPVTLEISTAAGEKFWTIVKEIDSEGVTIARIQDPLVGDNIHPRLEARGLPNDKVLLKILQDFAKGQSSIKALINQNTFLKGLIPQWETISATSIFTMLQNMVKVLGIDYERCIYRLYSQQFSELDRQHELDSLRSSLKATLIHNAKNEMTLNASQEGLNSIIAQQMWLQTGSKEHAYFLLVLPFYDGEVLRDARIAVESARKGIKVDKSHCHFGIELETQNLGTLGTDVWLYEDQIHIKILSDNLKLNENIFESLFLQTKVQFEKIGLKLMTFRQESLIDNKSFYQFIRGERADGVDLIG